MIVTDRPIEEIKNIFILSLRSVGYKIQGREKKDEVRNCIK
jgi:hypothetical protein